MLINTTPPGSFLPSFALQIAFDSGFQSNFVTSADINGDGRPDLVVTSFQNISGFVSVLLNISPFIGLPTFAAPQYFATGFVGSSSVTTADVDGDGRPDLLLANGGAEDTVSLMRNTTAPGAATSSFAPRQSFATGGIPVTVTPADFNGDGRPDLLAGNLQFRSNNVSVLLNTTGATAAAATPSFSPQQSFATGTGTDSVSNADMDGDWRRDLLVTNFFANTVSVLRNSTAPGAAAPGFAPQQDFATLAQPVSVSADDVNGDGRRDLLVTNQNANSISVLPNTTAPGSANYSFAVRQDFAAGTAPLSTRSADLNNDGKPDLLVANSGGVSLLRNTTPLGIATPSFAAQQSFATGAAASAVAAADLNGDGRLDLVASTNSDAIAVLFNTTPAGAASFTFAAPLSFPTGHLPDSVGLADVNGDGRADVLVTNSGANSISVLFNTTPPGAPVPSFAPQQNFPVGSEPHDIKIADLSGDGRPDLAVVNFQGNTISVLRNTTAAGAATPSFANAQFFATGTGPTDLTLTDFNGDGQPDLAAATQNPAGISVLFNTLYSARISAAIADNPGVGTILAADRTPNAFSFGALTDVAPNSVQTSNTVTVTGINTPVTISVVNGSYSIGCTATFVTTANTISNNQTVCARQSAAASFATTSTATLSIGTGSAGFSVTTGTAPTLSINNTVLIEGNSGSAVLNLPVILSFASPLSTSVTYTTSNVSASAGSDYTAISSTLTIPAGSTTAVVPVTISGDALVEGHETFTVTLSNPVNATLLKGSASGIILNDDGSSTLSFSAAIYSVTEAGPSAAITVTRSNALGSATVNVASSNGSALAGADYTAVATTLSFPANVTARTFSIAITDDATPEFNETVNLALSNPTGASLGAQASATVLIRDNEASQVRFSVAGYAVSEGVGSAVISVLRYGNSSSPATVAYSTSNGSALTGADYTAASGVLNFAANQISATFTVPISDDVLAEPNELLNLALSSPTGALLVAPSSATLLIRDNEPSQLRFSSASYSVNETSASATISVFRFGNVGAAASVSFATSNGTASAGSDYTSNSGMLNFSVNQNLLTFTVPIINDLDVETNEAVNLTLTAPTGAVLVAPSAASLTIISNE